MIREHIMLRSDPVICDLITLIKAQGINSVYLNYTGRGMYLEYLPLRQSYQIDFNDKRQTATFNKFWCRLTNKLKKELTPADIPDTTVPNASKRGIEPQPDILADVPNTGDIVMATAGEINHPAVEKGDIGESYLIFGIVHSCMVDNTEEVFCTKCSSYNTPTLCVDLLNVHWIKVKEGGKSYFHFATGWDVDGNLNDEYVTIQPVEKSKVRVVVKNNSPFLCHLNKFLAKEIS